ncbi:BON domain-containing protein [Pusillimonas sp.]|uniref:BON domain-containing protein n=1 Tax=Pusillimonas sp. TaxID=3040095 RepID=UPI00299FAA8C|nr:BON domain-containing protein [Pusillimonas sp.]MDX3894167.1 BON domain-containing protein [Pusillimonas sp.]
MRNEDERRYGRSPPPERGARSYDYFGREDGQREYDEHSGAHALEPWERLRSRSADPGQSSYGGFTNEDPRYQGQQFHRRRSSQENPVYGRPDSMRGAYPDPGEGFRERRIAPKGYKRSDERVREDVCERLSYSGLDVSDVSVQVSQGKVTLEGSVASRRDKHAVEDCVDDCLGVEDIDNRIRVARPEASGSGKHI